MNPKLHFSSKYFLILIALASVHNVYPQSMTTITLDSCQYWAAQNHPLSKQNDLIEQTRQLTIDHLASRTLPQVLLSAQATYQSDVTRLPLDLPGIDIPQVPYDQYIGSVEVTQPLNQFGLRRAEVEKSHVLHDIQKKELDVSLHTLRQRVNDIYFGILLLNAQIKQHQISGEDLKENIDGLIHAYEHGTTLYSHVEQLKAEALRLEQLIYATQAQQRHLISILSRLTNRKLSPDMRFLSPSIPTISTTPQRAELDLYQLRKKEIDQSIQIFRKQINPQFNLFIRGGYGRPTLNFLDDAFGPYYVAGIRATWNLSSRYFYSQKLQLWDVQKRIIDTHTETFLLNQQLEILQYDEEIERYITLIAMDEEIIKLRSAIRQMASEQLQRGIITPLDYTSVLREEERARQSRSLNEIKLLQAHYNRHHEKGY